VALARRGWQVEVLERAPEFSEVGAGLSVWANGVRALDALGVGEAIRGHAALEGQGGIQDNRGRWLARTNGPELERRYGPRPPAAVRVGRGLSGRRAGNGAASCARG
jgi:2-polyprenyl-6-methoxyphenol hydroxylase-like FAD-dependent oxidoreductase